MSTKRAQISADIYISNMFDICIITSKIKPTTKKLRLLKTIYFSFTFILNITTMNESDIINLIITFYEANRHLSDVGLHLFSVDIIFKYPVA